MVFQFHGASHPAQYLAAAQHVLRHAILRVYVHAVAGAQHAVFDGIVFFQRRKAAAPWERIKSSGSMPSG